MLGDFLTRILVLLLGYAYPAFECYKTVEKNKIDIEKLRFWCQYWILVALITSFERVGDIFISWLPMYGEAKVLFFIYLWHPKTKGTGYVYQTLLRPYIAEHETDIDRKIMEMKARAWDFFILHWQKCAQMGHSTLLQAFQYVVAQSISFSNPPTQKEVQQTTKGVSQPPPETQAEPQAESRPINKPLSTLRSMEKQPSKGKKWPPPTPPPTPSRATTESPRSNGNNFNAHTEDSSVSIPDTLPESPITDARARLRRAKPTA